jgi:DNA-binding IclR family transcriptional regulator
VDGKVSLTALGLLHIIARREGERTTRADLARLSGRTVESVDRLTRILERDGRLRVERRPGHVNVYVVSRL